MSREITVSVNYVKAHIKRKKDFIIHIVPNKFNVDYAKYINNAQKVIEINKKIQNAANIDELKKLENEVLDMGLDSILEAKYGLIETIMIANDYEFDREWWDKRADPADIERIVVECALKDKAPEAKKKMLERHS
jgi:hypothetical protein